MKTHSVQYHTSGKIFLKQNNVIISIRSKLKSYPNERIIITIKTNQL
jgi:hypothetical protein